jgi:hypothetical protein
VKLLLIIAVGIVAMIVGFAAGIEFEKLRHVRSDVQQQLQSNWREQHGITVVSLGVLDALETGDTEEAKSLLARVIGIYYRAFKDHEISLPAQQRLKPEIDALSVKSATLKEELQRPSK